MDLGFTLLGLGFRARMLEVGTHRILLSAVFLYTFAHLMTMRLICALSKFVLPSFMFCSTFLFLCWVLVALLIGCQLIIFYFENCVLNNAICPWPFAICFASR
jgi:hypothetical protein